MFRGRKSAKPQRDRYFSARGTVSRSREQQALVVRWSKIPKCESARDAEHADIGRRRFESWLEYKKLLFFSQQ